MRKYAQKQRQQGARRQGLAVSTRKGSRPADTGKSREGRASPRSGSAGFGSATEGGQGLKEAKDILGDIEEAADPLTSLAETSEIDQEVYEQREIVGLIERVWKLGQSGNVGEVNVLQDFAMLIIARATSQYSTCALRSQLQMLLSSMHEEGVIVNERRAQVMEEPLAWRQLANSLGVRAYGADIFVPTQFWTEASRHIGGRAAKGFGSGGGAPGQSGVEIRCLDEETLSAFSRVTWYLLTECDQWSRSPSSMPRLILPASYARSWREQDAECLGKLQTYDFHVYSGRDPPSELLVSYDNSVVLLIRETAVPPEEHAWSLLNADTQDEVEVDPILAPVVVLTAVMHGVEAKMAPWSKRVVRVLEDVQEDRNTQSKEESSMPFFLQPMIGGLMKDQVVADATRRLVGEISPHIRDAYSKRWAEVREEWLLGLSRAKTSLLASLNRQREREKRAILLRSALEEAGKGFDQIIFNEKAAEAERLGVITVEEHRVMAEKMAASVAGAEAPFRSLVKCSEEQGAAESTDPFDLESLQAKLEQELANTPLPERNPWRKAGKELSAALTALRLLQEAVTTGASSSEVREALARGEVVTTRFEQVASEASNSGYNSFQALQLRKELHGGVEALSRKRADEVLAEALAFAPWGGPLAVSSVSERDVRELREMAANATEAGRQGVAEALEKALAAGSCAVAVQQAAEGTDIDSIRLRIEEARGAGVCGLEPVQQRLSALQADVEGLRSDLSDAVEALDDARFRELAAAAEARGLGLPDDEQTRLRAQLAAGVLREEELLRSLLEQQPLPAEALRHALELSKLPKENAWYSVVDAVCLATEASKSVEVASDDDAEAVEEAIVRTMEATEYLEECLSLVNCPAGLQELVASLQEESEAAAANVATSKANADLVRALDSFPWSEGVSGLMQVKDSDVMDLEAKAAKATAERRERLQQSLDSALTAGRCVVALREAMQGSDPEALSERIREATDLGFEDLEDAKERQREMQAELSNGSSIRQGLGGADLLDDSKWAGEAGPREMRLGYRNMIFLDLELTAGFYEFGRTPRILEAAIIITDQDLRELGRGHWVIGGFSRDELEALGEFHQTHFRDEEPGGPFPPRQGFESGNGLFAEVAGSSLSRETMEEEVLALLGRHCPENACPLVGYSVQCDREVLMVEMPRVYSYLSHRIVDISSIFHLARLWVPDKLRQWDRRNSRYNHRANNDVEDSVEALRWIRENLLEQQPFDRGGVAWPAGWAEPSTTRKILKGKSTSMEM